MQNKIVTCQISDVKRGMLVARGRTMSHVSVTIKCHCLDFTLVLIYVSLIQFNPYLCVFDSILTQFF